MSLRLNLPLHCPRQLWQLKSFWRYSRLDERDVDFEAFSVTETNPLIPRSLLDRTTRSLVDESCNNYSVVEPR